MKKIKQFKPEKHKSKTVFNPYGHIDALYSTDKWRKYSRKFLSHNPKCYCCGAASSVTDHIEAHKGKIELFWKVNNYLPLCSLCHNTITAKFDRHGRQLLGEKLKYIAQMRAKLEVHVRVKVVPIDSE